MPMQLFLLVLHVGCSRRLEVSKLAQPCPVQDAVSKGAPLLALLGFILLPIIWSVPEALVTAG